MQPENEENDIEFADSDNDLSIGFPKPEENNNSGFDLKNIDIKDVLQKTSLQSITICEECIILATRSNQLIRKKLIPEGEYEVLSVPCKHDQQIVKLFSDVHGFHTIIECTKDEYFYLNLGSPIIIPLDSLKTFQITALAFSLYVTMYATGNILFGTAEGVFNLYELEIHPKQGILETPPKRVFQLPQITPIIGLAFDMYDCESVTEKISSVGYVIAATNDSIYQFSGDLPLIKLFEKYANSATSDLSKFKKTVPIPKGKTAETEFKICYLYKGTGLFELHSFVWKTYVGAIHGKFRDKTDVKSRVYIKEMPHEPYRRKGISENAPVDMPDSIAASEFSIYLLYPDSMTVISKISHEVTQMESFRHHSDPMLSIIYEASSRSLWLNSAKTLLRLMFQNSKKDMWKQHIESGNFQEALNHCKEHDPKNYGKVAGLYANAMFKNGKYSEAAVLYSESNISFEEVVLRFLKAGVTYELEVYLTKKLESIKNNQEKMTQKVILCAWLVELKLDKLNKLGAAAEGELPENASELKLVQKREAAELYKKAEEEFKSFLIEYEESLEVDTTYQLLLSHGKLADCLSFATQKKNYENVLLHHINNRDYKTAIEVANEIKDEKTKNSLMIRYSSVFMKHEAKFTIDSLSRYYPRINIEDLIASLIGIDSKDRLFANSYIKQIMDRTNNKLLYNLYVFFLAESKTKDSIDELNGFLDQQESFQKANQPVYLDKDFALNVCKHFELIDAQIKVYGLLEFYEEAVKLALSNKKINEAKKYANYPIDEKLRKKLWIEIAKSIMQTAESDIKKGFEIINESKILTLGDVLPFLSPKMKLSAFKDDLVASLQTYGSKIKDLKHQMEDYSKSAEEITSQLKELQNSCIPVPTDQFCDKCKKPLLGNERFYVFPCLHTFHRQCLIDWMFEFKAYVPKYKLSRLERINEFMKRMSALEKREEEEAELSMMEQQQSENKGFLNTLGNLFMRTKTRVPEEQKHSLITVEDRETMKKYEIQLEQMLTDDCMLCGNLFVESVDLPFDSSEECVWTI